MRPRSRWLSSHLSDRLGWPRGGSAFAQTPTPVITIEESIATLREMIAEVESGSTMIVAPIVGQFD